MYITKKAGIILFLLLASATISFGQICVGGSTSHYCPGTSNKFRWSISGGGTIVGATNSCNISVNWTSAGTYYVYYSDLLDFNNDFSEQVTVVTAVGGSVSPSSSTICQGSGTTLSLSGYSGSIVRWESSTDGSNYSTISNTSSSYGTGSLSSTTYFRALVTNCSQNAYSSVATVNVSVPNAGSTSLSSGSGSFCSGESASGTVIVSGYSGTVSSWQKSEFISGSWTGWTTAGAGHDINYFDFSVNVGTRYRAAISAGVCGTIYSSYYEIVSSQPTVAGNVTGPSIVCAGSAFSLGISGNVGTVQAWYKRSAGGSYGGNIGSVTNITIAQPSYFKAAVKNGNCFTTLETPEFFVDTYPSAVGGTVSSSTTICQNGSANLSLSGYSGTIIRWEKSTDGSNWQSVSNTTTSLSTGSLSATTSYRAVIQNACSVTANSSSATVTVNVPNAGSASLSSGSASFCSGESASGTVIVSGYSGTLSNWEKSEYISGSWTSWTSAGPGHDINYFDFSVNKPTRLRAKTNAGVCGTLYSNYVEIVETAPTVAGNVTGPTSVCAGSAFSLGISGNVGTVQAWYKRSVGGSYGGNIGSVTNITIAQPSYFKAAVKNGNCFTILETPEFFVDTYPSIVGGTVSSNTTVCQNGSANLSLSGYSGTIIRWEKTTDGTNWQIVSNTTTSLSTGSLSATTSYRAVIQNACSVVNSTSATVTVDVPPAPVLSPASYSFCEFEAMTMSPSNSTGYPGLKWYNASNQLLNAGLSYTPTNLDNGTYTYNVKNVSSNNCESPNPTVVTLQVGYSNCESYINWQESITYTYSSPTDFTGTVAANSKVYSDGFGNTIQSQAKSLANNLVFASENIYDKLGGQTLTTLPAPINSSTFAYRYRFITNNDPGNTGAKQKYSWSDFDATSGLGSVDNPNPVGNNGPGTLGWYYSSANNLELNTPTTNYPYARTYTPAGPNPVTTKSAGPGDAYKMGSTHETKGDKLLITTTELSHYYSLRSYFNITTPAPVGSPGYKFISTNPDGKRVASFVDADGNNLASAVVTSLVGVTPVTYDNNTWSYNYYNDLGQLVASVAPNGVSYGSSPAYPNYTTTYKYDQLGRLIETTSPDEGTSQFVYSTDGKIRFSQNQEQRNASNKRFSYTNYDYLGRLIESGEYTNTLAAGDFVFEPVTTTTPATNSVLNMMDNIGYSGVTRRGHNATATHYSDTTFIDYDMQTADFISDGIHTLQNNLTGQVSRTKNGNTTWYSYDEFGNVEWTMQNIVGLGNKTVDYTYDFLGNVTQVAYQKGQTDAFYHHYTYNADNKLTLVETSFNGVTKSTQAKYYYYLHGPLKRVELGNSLQGIDYIYNINGSLKAINHPDPNNDPGADGISGTNASFVKDAFGMALDYYANDYVPATTNTFGSVSPTGTINQYSGLIKTQRWHSQVDNHQQKAYAYNYDNLNRFSAANWGTVSGSAGNYSFSPASPSAYLETIGGYDKNGNIQNLNRNNKAGTAIGNYTYNYAANKNQLSSISGNTTVTYQYNTIGQMTQQTEGSNTMNVSYNAYGLTKEVRDGSNNLMEQYFYDDRGDLVKKTTPLPASVGTGTRTTYYVRDASGNLMATYEQNGANAVALVEQPVYGAGRVGMMKPKGGQKMYFYEVNDHQGNVRAVIGAPTTDQPTASYEPTNANFEQNQFLRTEDAIKINATLFNKTNGGSASQRLNGSNNEKYGLARSIVVNPGDVINAEVYAKYVDTDHGNWTTAFNTLIGQIANNTGGIVTEGANYTSGTNLSSFPFPSTLDKSGSTGAGPKAFLTWLIFDRNFVFSTGGYARLSGQPKESGQNVAHELMASPPINITEPGYMYIYISNENDTPVEVYFDDFKVTQVHDRIVAGGDYYPFGLPMVERQITQERYRFGYQGQFSEYDSLTKQNTFQLRRYDARFGRWLSPDPKGQYASPYIGMGNNPVNGVDPNGGIFGLGAVASGMIIGGAIGTAAGLIVDPDHWYYYTAGGIGLGALGGGIYNANTFETPGLGRYGMNPSGASPTVGLSNPSFIRPAMSGAIMPVVNAAINLELHRTQPASYPEWLDVALKEEGVSEQYNDKTKKSNPRIMEYFKSTGYDASNDRDDPWCAAFMHWVMKQNGKQGGGVGAGWKTWGVGLNKPALGAIVYFTWDHVGMVAGVSGSDNLIIIHGNWGNAVQKAVVPKTNISLYRFPKGRTPIYFK